MKKASGRKLLQIIMGVLGTAPLLTGILGLSGIYNPIYAGKLSDNVLLDSNLRFLNGLSVGIGIAVYVIIPAIEKQTLIYRIIWGCVFTGGIGRLISIYLLGLPPWPMPFFIAIEVICPPFFIYWQCRVAASRTH